MLRLVSRRTVQRAFAFANTEHSSASHLFIYSKPRYACHPFPPFRRSPHLAGFVAAPRKAHAGGRQARRVVQPTRHLRRQPRNNKDAKNRRRLIVGVSSYFSIGDSVASTAETYLVRFSVVYCIFPCAFWGRLHSRDRKRCTADRSAPIKRERLRTTIIRRTHKPSCHNNDLHRPKCLEDNTEHTATR